MGQKIWDVLAWYEGSWVAVTSEGRVLARAGSLSEATRLVADNKHRVTFLYAAGPSPEEEPAGKIR
jgi:hypothetical protein